MLTVGIDLGGTFVDGYFSDEERWLTCKVPTRRFDLTRSVVACIGAGADAFAQPLEAFLERIDLLRLSTTVGTNAIVEGNGSRIGLVVAAGEEQKLYGAKSATALFDTFIAAELVRGTTLPLEAEAVLSLCRELIDGGVRRVVVSFPRGASTDERAAQRAVQERYPEHYLRSVPLQLGSEISACTEDDVRTATAVVNAYLHRDMAQLLHHTEQELRSSGLRSSLLVVHANSGVARASKTTAISTYSSGPAAGLSAAERISARNGDRMVLTADMGGTTLDLGLVRDGQCEVDVRPMIAGVRVALAMNSTESVGCAGCSIVSVDGNAVRIGPESAGAVPGPAAFAMGGEVPTLTDADVVTGLLEAGKVFGGQFVLDADRARQAIQEGVANGLGCSVDEAAARIERQAAEDLGSALLSFLGQRKIDPADVILYAFGGAGPVHMSSAAQAAGIRRLRTFPFGSGFSAFGCTVVGIRHRYEAAVDHGLAVDSWGEATVSALIARGRADIRAERFSLEDSVAVLHAVGKDGMTLASSGAREVGGATEIADLLVRDMSTQLIDDVAVDALILELSVPVPTVDVPTRRHPGGSAEPEEVRQVQWTADRRFDTPVYRWERLPIGFWIEGPALVEERDTTHAVSPGWRVSIDVAGDAVWEAM